MAIVEGIRVHLHEQHHAVQYEEDLGSPCPIEDKRHDDPECQPCNLVDALDGHAALVPGPRTPALPEQLMQRQADSRAPDHEEFGNGQVPRLDGEQGPDLHTQGISGVLVIAQHGSDAHDGEADPEEVEEAMEVAIVGVGIEVGDARGEFGGREETSSLFGADLLACARQGLGRGRGVFGDGRRATAARGLETALSRGRQQRACTSPQPRPARVVCRAGRR